MLSIHFCVRWFIRLLIIMAYGNLVYADELTSHIAHPPHHIKPNTSLTSPSGLSPAIISKAYGFNFVPYQGEGQTVAIIDAYDDPTIESDLATFNTAFNLPDCTIANGCLTVIYASGNQPIQDNNWNMETALDVEWVHAVAPKAKIMLVEATDATYSALFAAIGVAIAQGAKTLSLSWGGSEFASQTVLENLLKTYVAGGATFFAASGDYGYGIYYPASSAYVVSVGGTSLSVDSSGYYTGETAWSGSGGGLSARVREPTAQINYPLPKANSKRGVPDVSYHADPNTGYSVYDSANGGWNVVGGTSAGAPQWAAIIALAKSGTHKKLNSVYNALYALGKSNFKYYYNDPQSGTNGNCGYYCTSRAGYDYVTGIGTPQVPYIINGLMFSGLDSQ